MKYLINMIFCRQSCLAFIYSPRRSKTVNELALPLLILTQSEYLKVIKKGLLHTSRVQKKRVGSIQDIIKLTRDVN